MTVEPQQYAFTGGAGSNWNQTVNVTSDIDTSVAVEMNTTVTANETNTTGVTVSHTPERFILDPGNTTAVTVSVDTHTAVVPDTFYVDTTATSEYPKQVETNTVTNTDTETEVETVYETVEQVRWNNDTRVVYRNETEIVEPDVNKTRVNRLLANISRLQERIDELEEEQGETRTGVTGGVVTVTETVTETVVDTVFRFIPGFASWF